MPDSALHLTFAERDQLECALHRTRHSRTWCRMRALLLVSEGVRVMDVAAALGVRRQAIHKWRTLYEVSRTPESLEVRSPPGREPNQVRFACEAVPRLLEKAPGALGYRATAWTVPLLERHLREVEGHTISGSTLRRALHELGYRWKRPRFVLARRDPEREEKKAGTS
ncbi:MAG TPA: winged helix-turn-helix domain-containing protein [Chloroflexota bacterium]|nr:winged helix-turn-helix domain-containing protein [Chloroflexota bacterium]